MGRGNLCKLVRQGEKRDGRLRGGAKPLCGPPVWGKAPVWIGYWPEWGVGHQWWWPVCSCNPPRRGALPGPHYTPPLHLPSGAPGLHQARCALFLAVALAMLSCLGQPAFCPSYAKNAFFYDYQSNTHHFGMIGRYRKVLRSTKTNVSYNLITQSYSHLSVFSSNVFFFLLNGNVSIL